MQTPVSAIMSVTPVHQPPSTPAYSAQSKEMLLSMGHAIE